MAFADIHCHTLFGCDDGPKTEGEMYALMDASYNDGVRYICFTPHCHLGFWGNNHETISTSFSKAQSYARINYPDLSLKLGSELRCSRDIFDWLEAGLCRTMAETDCVLVDFSEWERGSVIADGLRRLLSAGYTPILAHAERYGTLSPTRDIPAFRDNGVLIQVDTQSLFGSFGLRARGRAGAILRGGFADFIASDAHDLRRRPPHMANAHRLIQKKHGSEYADVLCLENALRHFWPEDARKV